MKILCARLAAAALVTMLAACVSGEPPPAAPPPDTVVRSTEQGGKFISLVGPRHNHGESFLGVPGTNYFALRTWIDTRNGETAHQLYVEDSYFGAKREWNKAHDKAGTELRFVPIAVNEITCNPNCSYAEEFAAALPEAMLRANPQGIMVIFDAKSGERMTVSVPGELIQKQLASTEAARAGLQTVAATASGPPAPPPAANPAH